MSSEIYGLTAKAYTIQSYGKVCQTAEESANGRRANSVMRNRTNY